jgi:CubicO group peptidase (beta-lactamase class C family)
MKLKAILIIILFLIFFLGEISTSFSFKSENDRNNFIPNPIPLSYKVTNSLSINTETRSIDSIIIDFLQRNRIVGASVAITKEGRLIYTKGFGFADKETSDSVSPRSLFRIASVSKLITAVAIMKLVDDEKLDINARVFGPQGILNDSVYLQYNDKRYENITIYHLLNHTAGWNGRKTDPVFNSLYVAKIMDVVPPAQTPVIIEYALSKKLDYNPGKNYSYSNLGYCVLGEVIKKVTGMEYEDYVQFAILHPLGIWDMHIGKSFFNEKYLNEVRYYNLERSTKIWAFDGSQERVPLEYGGNNIELLGPAGGWIASAPELAKLMTSIDGFDSRPDILSKSSIAFMTEDRTHSRSFIGWRGTDGHGTWWRTGTLTGTSALIMRHANGINWIVLLNTTTNRRSHIHNKLSHTMFSALYRIHKWPDNDLFNYESPTIAQQQLSSGNN